MSWRTVTSTGASFWLFNDKDGAQLFLEHEVAGRFAAHRMVVHLYGQEAADRVFTQLETERRAAEAAEAAAAAPNVEEPKP